MRKDLPHATLAEKYVESMETKRDFVRRIIENGKE